MRGWNDEAQWVCDENGLRSYFSERDPGGPSRLECYRRLLGQPVEVPRRASILTVHARDFANVLEITVFPSTWVRR
jgi:hypothetical protein